MVYFADDRVWPVPAGLNYSFSNKLDQTNMEPGKWQFLVFQGCISNIQFVLHGLDQTGKVSCHRQSDMNADRFRGVPRTSDHEKSNSPDYVGIPAKVWLEPRRNAQQNRNSITEYMSKYRTELEILSTRDDFPKTKKICWMTLQWLLEVVIPIQKQTNYGVPFKNGIYSRQNINAKRRERKWRSLRKGGLFGDK